MDNVRIDQDTFSGVIFTDGGFHGDGKALKEDKVEIPAVHMAKKDAGLWKGRVEEIKDPYGWGSSTVAGILKKREYPGHTVNFKTRKHFKDKKSHYVSEDNWTVFENTQEAIIDQETFDNVQRIRSNVRRYPDGWGEAHPLTGLMYCAECGSKMYVHRVNNGKRVPQYTCSAYSKVPVGTLCQTQHRINADVVMELIKELLKSVAEYSKLNREEFLETVKKAQTSQQSSEITRLKNRLAESMRTIFLASCQMNAMRFLMDSILKNRKICRQKLQIWKLNYQAMKKVADQRRSLLLWLINTKILRN